MNPYELIYSISEKDIKHATSSDPMAYGGDSKTTVANYVRMIKLAPKFLEFVKDSMYITTNKYENGDTYTSFSTHIFEITSDNFTYKILNDHNEIIDVVVDSEAVDRSRKKANFESSESWANTSGSKIANNIIENFFKNTNVEKLKILKSIINSNLISQEEWDAAFALNEKYKIVTDYCNSLRPYTSNKILEDHTIHDIVVAAQKIEQIVEDGDLVIFVGNTPQLIRYPFEKITSNAKPNVKTVSLALSGHPGQIKKHYTNGIISNILKPESHEAYKEYMQHMGITAEYVKDHNVHLVDCVGSGGGLLYLTNTIAEIAHEGKLTDDAAQKIDIIALNEIDRKYAKFSNKLGYHNLKMNELTKTLDRISDDDTSLRLMPNSNSYKWTAEFIEKIEDHSKHIFENPNDFFQAVLHKIDMELETLGKVVNISE